MERICYGDKVEACHVLGPGTRAVLWVYGCPFHCEGCIAEGFKTGTSHVIDTEAAAAWYLSIAHAEGLTISGGEPMMQAKALAEMVGRIRSERDTGVIVYTGFTYEKLQEMAKEDPSIQAFLGQIDLLIDGPYKQELDNNQPYRGSENQRLIPLTERYIEALDTYYGQERGRQIELLLTDQRTLMAGVPGKDQAAIWQKIKAMGDR